MLWNRAEDPAASCLLSGHDNYRVRSSFCPGHSPIKRHERRPIYNGKYHRAEDEAPAMIGCHMAQEQRPHRSSSLLNILTFLGGLISQRAFAQQPRAPCLR